MALFFVLAHHTIQFTTIYVVCRQKSQQNCFEISQEVSRVIKVSKIWHLTSQMYFRAYTSVFFYYS